MKKVHLLLMLLLFLPFSLINSQTESIKLTLLADISSLDLGSLFIAKNLKGQPRIFQLVIEPFGKDVFVTGQVDWAQNVSSSPSKVFSFKTYPFKARTFFNDELDNTDISIEPVTDKNQALIDELMKRGKLTGVVKFRFNLFDTNNKFLAQDSDEITFLNPSAPRILLNQDQVFPIGNAIINWDEDPSAKDYIILANDRTSESQSDEAVLNSGNPLINNVSVGAVTNVNLSELQKRREFIPGDVIVVQVKKLVYDSGFPKYLASLPVRFSIEQPSVSSTVTLVPDADLVRLSTLLAGKVDQTILEKLSSGEIQPSQITILDKDGNTISFSDFVRVLGILELNPASITSTIYTPKQ